MTSYIVYGKANCPFCDKAKKLLDEMHCNYVYVDITNWSVEEKENLKNTSKMKTVPIIYKVIGGFSELQPILANRQDVI